MRRGGNVREQKTAGSSGAPTNSCSTSRSVMVMLSFWGCRRGGGTEQGHDYWLADKGQQANGSRQGTIPFYLACRERKGEARMAARGPAAQAAAAEAKLVAQVAEPSFLPAATLGCTALHRRGRAASCTQATRLGQKTKEINIKGPWKQHKGLTSWSSTAVWRATLSVRGKWLSRLQRRFTACARARGARYQFQVNCPNGPHGCSCCQTACAQTRAQDTPHAEAGSQSRG